MSVFSLNLRPVLGSHLEDCCKDAFRLAAALSLHDVNFEWNGSLWCVYPDGSGRNHLTGDTWTLEGGVKFRINTDLDQLKATAKEFLARNPDFVARLRAPDPVAGAVESAQTLLDGCTRTQQLEVLRRLTKYVEPEAGPAPDSVCTGFGATVDGKAPSNGWLR